MRLRRPKKIGRTLPTAYKRSLRVKSPSNQSFLPRRPQKRFSKGWIIFKKILIIITLLSLVAGTSYATIFSQFLIIDSIKYQLDESELEEAELSPHLTNILGTNIISLQPPEYENQLKNIFPQIESVQIQKNFPRGIEVIVKTFPVSANIINKYAGLEKKFLINEGGYLISKDLENPNLPYIVVESEKEFDLKTRLMPEATLKKITATQMLFEDFFNIKIYDSIYLPSAREVHLRSERGFLVWLDLQLDIEKQLKKLKRALPQLNIYKENLEYIDLRIVSENGEKIYFRKR